MNRTSAPYSRRKSDPAQRFGTYVNTNGPTPSTRPGLGRCWIWMRSTFRSGYGAFHPKHGQTVLAHRYSWELQVGPIPDGHVLDHLCRNRACVNPAHLEPVSNTENLRRGKGYRLRNGMDDSCINGHAYTPDNTYINPNDNTDMRCRACSRDRDRRRAA